MDWIRIATSRCRALFQVRKLNGELDEELCAHIELSTEQYLQAGMSAEEAMKQFPEKAGIARYGKPEEVADLMAYMVSPAAKWMTGTSVRMDGGEIKGI